MSGRFQTSTCSSKIPTCYGSLPWFCLRTLRSSTHALLLHAGIYNPPRPPSLSPSPSFAGLAAGSESHAQMEWLRCYFLGQSGGTVCHSLRTHPFRPRSLCLVRERKLAACPISSPSLSLHLQIWAPEAIPVSNRHADSTTRQREREREKGGLISQVRSHTHPHTHTRTFSSYHRRAITLRVLLLKGTAKRQGESCGLLAVAVHSGCVLCRLALLSLSLSAQPTFLSTQMLFYSWLSLPPSLLSLALLLSLASPSLSLLFSSPFPLSFALSLAIQP